MSAIGWLEGFATPDGTRALGARLPQLVAGALALALAVQAALIVANLAGPARKSTLPGPLDAAPAGPRHSRLDVASLVNAHLFGTAPVAGADSASAPATSMSLVLAGVMANEDPARGIAILGEALNSVRVYTVGQSVPGGAKLHAVYDDRVILERNGGLETLVLPRQGERAGPAVAATNPAGGGNPLIERMRSVVESNPGAVLEVMRPQPVFVNGKQKGVRVYPGRYRQVFGRLGLHPGDLITAVNGTPLDDPSRSNEIFRTLGSAAEAHVTVMRNGREQDVVLNLAQAAADVQQTMGSGAAPAGPSEQQPAVPPPADSND